MNCARNSAEKNRPIMFILIYIFRKTVHYSYTLTIDQLIRISFCVIKIILRIVCNFNFQVYDNKNQ